MVSPHRGAGLSRGRSVDGMVSAADRAPRPQRPTQYIRRSADAAASARQRVAPLQAVVPATSAAQPRQMLAVTAPEPPAAPVYHRKHHWKLALVPACFVVFVGVLFLSQTHTRTHEVPHAKAAVLSASVVDAQQSRAPVSPPADNTAITAAMNTAIAAQPNLSAAATLIDLTNDTVYNAGSYTTSFEAASTSKLVAIFDYMHKVELGKATLVQKIDGVSALDNIMRMIEYSDNDAWARLNTYLTMPDEQAYTDALGLHAQMKYNDIRFTSADMARLLQLLYEGKLMDTEHQAIIYNYMAHTTVTNLIQAALPADAKVYHKYGQVDGVLHDASIVEYQGHRFVLVVYTNNPAGTTNRAADQINLIHAVTSAAFKAVIEP